ncbi:unnamed protein product [marine sediment metagenome]|uniref:Uncharacterized protein n=1 Tax=marine sediment metagenome TaxID=412755 RepID=X1AWQ8_9ZZZZ
MTITHGGNVEIGAGQLLVQPGTVPLPGLANINDPDTGILIGANSLNFIIGGSPAKLHLASDGDVGIGTSMPSEKLEVQGSTATYIGVDAGATSMTGIRLYAGGVKKWDIYRESNSASNANNLNFISSGKGSVWSWIRIS